MLKLEPIRDRLTEATPRPWHLLDGKETHDNNLWHVYHANRGRVASRMLKWDADFILNAPTDIESLLAEVERLRDENDELRAENRKKWAESMRLYGAILKHKNDREGQVDERLWLHLTPDVKPLREGVGHEKNEPEALRDEVKRLRAAIRKHKDSRLDPEVFGWVRDKELWAVLDA